MITIETTLQQFNEVTAEMIAMAAGIPNHLFNTVPFEGSWTAGQLLRHMIKSEESMLTTLKGDTITTTTRNGDEHVEGLKETFLNFGQKFDAPDFIVPEATEYDKDALLATFKKGREEIAYILQHTNALDTCTSHPILTNYTKLEIVWFVIVHTMRHNKQLEKMIANL